jgi:hypothetical protein
MAVDLEAAIELARLCEQISDTDEEFELASRTLPALVAELEASRTAGDQLRAVLDDLIRWARAGTLHRSTAVGGYDKEKFDEVDRLAGNAVRLLGVIQSPPQRVGEGR